MIFHGLLVKKRWEWPFYEPFRSYFFVGIRSHSGVSGRASTNLTTVAVAARSPPPSPSSLTPLPRSSPPSSSTSSSLWPRPGVGVTWQPTLDQSAGEGQQPHPHGGFLPFILMEFLVKRWTQKMNIYKPNIQDKPEHSGNSIKHIFGIHSTISICVSAVLRAPRALLSHSSKQGQPPKRETRCMPPPVSAALRPMYSSATIALCCCCCYSAKVNGDRNVVLKCYEVQLTHIWTVLRQLLIGT